MPDIQIPFTEYSPFSTDEVHDHQVEHHVREDEVGERPLGTDRVELALVSRVHL